MVDVFEVISDDEPTGADGDHEDTPEEQLSECYPFFSIVNLTKCFSEAAQLTWRSPIYSFFKSNVSVCYEGTRMYHFFPCSSRRCKSETGGCRRFQDKGDRSSTSNLKAHAIGCFGEEAVKLAISAKAGEARSGNIFSVFVRQGPRIYVPRLVVSPRSGVDGGFDHSCQGQ